MRRFGIMLVIGVMLVPPSARAEVPHDRMEDAKEISYLPFSDEMDYTSATHVQGEPAPCWSLEGQLPGVQQSLIEGVPSLWYRYTGSSDGAIIAQAYRFGVGSLDVSAYRRVGTKLERAGCASSSSSGGYTPPIRIEARAGEVFLFEVAVSRDYSPWEDNEATFSLERTPDADVAATALSWKPVPFETDLGPTPFEERHDLTFEIANTGTVAALAFWTLRTCALINGQPSPHCVTSRGQRWLTVGARWERTLRWSFPGVGDFLVSIEVDTVYETDTNATNDRIEKTLTVIAGGQGFGCC